MSFEFQTDLERLRFVLEASQLALWDWDMVTGEIFVDTRWAAMIGYTVEELAPVTIERFSSLVNPADAERVFDLVAKHDRGDTPFYEAEFRFRHKDGHWAWVRARGLIVERKDDGAPSRMTGVHEDITERHDVYLQLQVRSRQLEAAQRLGKIGSWYWDLSTDEVNWSDELFTMQGFDPAEPVPPASRHAELFTEKSWELLSAALTTVSTSGEPYELELEMERGAGPIGWMLARGEAVRNEYDEIVGVFGIAQDITARKHAEERLRTMAMQDDLSLLGNRVALNGFLDHALERAREKGTRVGCVMLDLDDFKKVNDTLGHAAGDEVIQIAANRLARLTRKSDTAFRLSGDEFVIVLESLKDDAAAYLVGERIVTAFHEPLSLESAQVEVTASVGIAFSGPDTTRSDLLRKADAALYSAKRTGKDKWLVFSPELIDSPRNSQTQLG